MIEHIENCCDPIGHELTTILHCSKLSYGSIYRFVEFLLFVFIKDLYTGIFGIPVTYSEFHFVLSNLEIAKISMMSLFDMVLIVYNPCSM